MQLDLHLPSSSFWTVVIGSLVVNSSTWSMWWWLHSHGTLEWGGLWSWVVSSLSPGRAAPRITASRWWMSFVFLPARTAYSFWHLSPLTHCRTEYKSCSVTIPNEWMFFLQTFEHFLNWYQIYEKGRSWFPHRPFLLFHKERERRKMLRCTEVIYKRQKKIYFHFRGKIWAQSVNQAFYFLSMKGSLAGLWGSKIWIE